MNKSPQAQVSINEAKAKIEHYCAYQERAQQEVRDKLYSYGLHHDEVEQLISQLIEENFLNEERFAMAYAGGKFRMQHWGRIKIKAGLKAKQVSERLITKALNAIDPLDYEASLENILSKKLQQLNEKDTFKLRQRLLTFAYSKGYEKDLILNSLTFNDLNKSH